MIQTVLGPVDPGSIGTTLMHEHALVDLRPFFTGAQASSDTNAPVDISMLSALRRRPLGVSRDNLVLESEDEAVDELSEFKRAGGSTIVDCTLLGIGRNPSALRRISEATGIHIVQGTGLYVDRTQPQWARRATESELSEFFIHEITIGIGDSGVRAGVLGEIGTSSPSGRGELSEMMTNQEGKVLRAAAIASQATGVSIIIHLDPRVRGALEVVQLLTGLGVSSDRIVLGHMDANPELEYHLACAELGVYLSYDHFGREYFAAHMSRAYPSDESRIRLLKTMIDAGYAPQIVVSQDICMKIDLVRYGGVGYSHFIKEIVPILRRRGVTQDQIDQLVIANPRRILAMVTS